MTVADIRKAKTSDLLALILNHDVLAAALDGAGSNSTPQQVEALIVAIGVEIDRRIPVPPPEQP